VVGGGLVGGSLVGSGGGVVVGLSLVLDISDIARVGIGNVVGDNLGAAIGKSNAVLAVGGIVVTGLVGGKVGARVVVVDGIAVLVDSGAIIRGLVVGSGLVGGGRGMVGGGVNGSLVGGGMDGSLVSGSGVIDRGGLVGRGGVVDGGGLVSRGSMVSRGGMVSGGVDGNVGGGMSSGRVLLLVVGLVHLVGLGRGLAHDLSVVGAMGLVHGGVDSGGIALLDGLVGRLVGRGQGQEGEDSHESLKVDI